MSVEALYRSLGGPKVPAVGSASADPDNSLTFSPWTGKSQRPIWFRGLHDSGDDERSG